MYTFYRAGGRYKTTVLFLYVGFLISHIGFRMWVEFYPFKQSEITRGLMSATSLDATTEPFLQCSSGTRC